MADLPKCYVVTGNITRGVGTVAYLRADGSFGTVLDEAHPFEDRAQADAKLQEVKVREDVITEPYVFEAERTEHGIRPLSARERLRAEGPSTRLRRPDPANARAS